MDPKERLIFALDVPSRQEALGLADLVGPEVGWLKIGLELFIGEGPDLVRQLARRARIFLDLKLHDIPATVGRAAAAAAALGAKLVTVHAEQPGALRQAVDAAPELGVLAVTVLTSLSSEEVAGLTGGRTPEALVVERALMARDAGCRGVVCSGREAAAVRAAVGPARFLIVTPGVRPAGVAAGDQARVVTPRAAREAGADLIVVGRPIRDAADPVKAARQIVAQLAG